MNGYDDGPAPDPDAGQARRDVVPVPPPSAPVPPPSAPGPHRASPYPPPGPYPQPQYLPPQYSQPQYPPAGQYPQPPYSQPPYGPAPYGPAPYGPAPYGQAPYGYGQAPYGPAPYGPAPYGPPAYGTPQHLPGYGRLAPGAPSVVVPPLFDPPRRRGNGPVVVATIVVWALVMVGIVVGVDALAGGDRPVPAADDPSALVRVADPDELPPPVSTSARIPSPGFEEESRRLEPVAAPAVPSDEYAFLDTYGGGEPVAWSPCRPIHVVVNGTGAPEGFVESLLDALGRITTATGLVFVYDGPTDERPDLDRASYLPERYGDRWAPVLVAWADDKELTDFEDDVVGLALSESRGDRTTDAVVRVTGEVYLDTELRTYPDDPTGQEPWVSVLHHELGHLVGLDHVDETDQLMYPEDSGRLRSYQEGDLAGLYELGQGACAPGL